MREDESLTDTYIIEYLSENFVPEVVRQVVETAHYEPPTIEDIAEHDRLEAEARRIHVNLASLKAELCKSGIMRSVLDPIPNDYLTEAINEKRNTH